MAKGCEGLGEGERSLETGLDGRFGEPRKDRDQSSQDELVADGEDGPGVLGPAEETVESEPDEPGRASSESTGTTRKALGNIVL